MKAQMRKKLQPKMRSVRKPIHKHVEQASEAEAEQLAILDDYALGVQTALNLEGKLPFDYAGVAAAEALDARRNESGEIGKKGEAGSRALQAEIRSGEAKSGGAGTMAGADRASPSGCGNGC